MRHRKTPEPVRKTGSVASDLSRHTIERGRSAAARKLDEAAYLEYRTERSIATVATDEEIVEAWMRLHPLNYAEYVRARLAGLPHEELMEVEPADPEGFGYYHRIRSLGIAHEQVMETIVFHGFTLALYGPRLEGLLKAALEEMRDALDAYDASGDFPAPSADPFSGEAVERWFNAHQEILWELRSKFASADR